MENLKDKPTRSEIIFAQWLELKLPCLMGLFDFEDRCYLPDRVDEYLDVASHGEAIMARFAVSIWDGTNILEFCHLDAAQTLDAENMKIITDWLTVPKFP